MSTKAPETKKKGPVFSALLLQILAQGRRPLLLPLPSCQCLQTCGACWTGVPRRALLPLALCSHCLQGSGCLLVAEPLRGSSARSSALAVQSLV